jgi:hypothetical protein
MERHLITLYALDRERGAEVLPAIAQALAGGTLGMPDKAGMVEVELSADLREEALERVRDAIAAAGAEERLTFPETTGTGYEPPGHRAVPPDERPPPEPPHLERGSPRDDSPRPPTRSSWQGWGRRQTTQRGPSHSHPNVVWVPPPWVRAIGDCCPS